MDKLQQEKQFKKALKSQFYHHKDKGCWMEDKVFLGEGIRSTVRGSFCKNHQKDLCRCGWEWGKHYSY